MSKVALDGIIPFALLGQSGGGGGGSSGSGSGIKNAQFTDNALIITTTQGNINIPFSPMLKHNNKTTLDNISVVGNTLYFKGEKVCNLDSVIKNVNIAENGILNIEYGSGIQQETDLKPIIEQTIIDSTNYSFYYGIIDSNKDLEFIEDKIKNGQLVIVKKDANYNNNRTIYIYFNKEWVYVGDVETNRDFTKEPISIEKETIGEFVDSRIPSSIARVSQLHFHNNLNILDKLQENVYGQLTFNGQTISDLKVTDGQNSSYNKVNNITFAKTLGVKEGETLKIIPKLKSIDLQDFPSNYKKGSVLVSSLSGYELESIENLTESKENFVTTITTKDWGSNETDGIYKKIVTHNLNSENLIVAFYDENKNSISKEYTILNPLNIEVKSNDNNLTTVVINCSQGTTKNDGSGGGGGVDHIHNNLEILNGFGEDKYDNLTWNGKRIYTNFDPYVFNKKWKTKFEEKTLLIDCSQVFQDVDARIFSNIEFSITNMNYKTGNEELDNKNIVKLFIVENQDNTILDISIPAGDFQKYNLGINPTIKIYVTGFFSADLTINYFDNKSAYSSLSNNEPLYSKEEINNMLANKVDLSKFEKETEKLQTKEDSNLVSNDKGIVTTINSILDKTQNDNYKSIDIDNNISRNIDKISNCIKVHNNSDFHIYHNNKDTVTINNNFVRLNGDMFISTSDEQETIDMQNNFIMQVQNGKIDINSKYGQNPTLKNNILFLNKVNNTTQLNNNVIFDINGEVYCDYYTGKFENNVCIGDNTVIKAKNDCVFIGSNPLNNASASDSNNIENCITLGVNAGENFKGNKVSNSIFLGNSRTEKIYSKVNGISVISDSRTKSNIELFDTVECLEKIQNLPVKTFSSKENPLEKSIGFIGQDIEKVLPTLVDRVGYSLNKSSKNKEKDKEVIDDCLTFNPTDLIPLLCGAIQELANKNNLLEEKINKLLQNK